MAVISDLSSTYPVIGALALVGLATIFLYRCYYNLTLHPLARFPGPKAAAVTRYWKAYIECILEQSFCHKLEDLHSKYGPVIRIGPDELHFSNPQAYHDIYNNRNRWDKERRLYHSFGEDRSSFGFITYQENKQRKEVVGRTFSAKTIEQIEPLITEKVLALCTAFAKCSASDTPVDIFYAFRCMTMDVITYIAFGKSVNAIDAPGFRAPIVLAMDASTDVFVRFKHAEWYKNMIVNCPPALTKILSPTTMGLINLQQIIKKQIDELVDDPEKLKDLPHGNTIYARLMDKEAYRTGTVPDAGSLYEESQALMFGGGDTTGNTLMVGTFHLLRRPEKYEKLKAELKSIWPNLNGPAPKLKDLEELPYTNAVIKEALRMSSGVVSGLLRVVPDEGATICKVPVPGKTIVSCGSTFVHYNEAIFEEPHEFKPERWLENPNLENWLVPFSRGPRMCLGLNLAWAELRMTVAHVFRKFELELTADSPTSLPFRDTFLPHYNGDHAFIKVTPSSA